MNDAASVFEALYAADPDPWHFATSPYERRKYRDTLQAIAHKKFRSGFEVGCSVGVMTAQLAGRCRRLLAIDVSENALRQSQRRCRGRTGVTLQHRSIPRQWPNQTFDLIVISEVLYFLDPQALVETADKVRRSLRRGGTLVLVNWTGPTDTVLNGDQAAGMLLRRLGRWLQAVRLVRRPTYRLDVLRRPA
jgi:SAM-dependent methyltransferase